MIKDIVDAVTIPVMAKVRIGHFVEAQVKFHILLLQYIQTGDSILKTDLASHRC